MKRQLDRLKGKRLVTGDPNLMTKDEICINATPNGVEVKEIGTDGKIKDLAGSGSGNNTDNELLEEPLYYKIKWPEDATAEMVERWQTMLYGFIPPNSYIVLEGGYKDMPNIEVPAVTSIPYSAASKIKLKITAKYITLKNESDYIVNFCKVNVVEFFPVIIEMLQEDELNFIEISKEEYYSDIEMKYEDIPIVDIPALG